MVENNYDKFKDLKYRDFRRLAKDASLSKYEKVGFPNSYRKDREKQIFLDIQLKLKNLSRREQVIFDVGPGCSDLAFMVIDHCQQNSHQLILVDSQEMLYHLPDKPFITKVPCYYPDECLWLFEEYTGRVDALLIYSVLHYVYAEGNLFSFLDRSLSLLSNGGEMLIGDIPNMSKRKRFFSSENGIKFHQKFMKTDEIPEVNFNVLEQGQIDDAIIISIIMHCREAGFDAYWLPQANDLPMANRREDILIRKP